MQAKDDESRFATSVVFALSGSSSLLTQMRSGGSMDADEEEASCFAERERRCQQRRHSYLLDLSVSSFALAFPFRFVWCGISHSETMQHSSLADSRYIVFGLG